MSQYLHPGVIKQNQGSSFKGTPGLYANESGGVADKVVVYSELETAQGNLTNLINQLEAAYQAADTQDEINWQAAIAGLQQQINNIGSGITQSLTVAVRLSSLPPGSQAGFIPGFNASPVDENDESAWLLIDDEAGGADNGIYRYDPGTTSFVRIGQLPGTLDYAAGTLVFVDGGASANSFWLVPDDGTASGVSFSPWGRVQDLSTHPDTFLTLIANELNAQVNTQWFAVVDNELTFSAQFIADFQAVQAGVATNANDIATNAGDIATNAGDIATNVNAIAANGVAINGNTAAIQSNDTDISALQAEQVTQDAAIAANAAGVASNTTAINGNTAAIQDNDTDISALQAEQVTQDAAIATNASGVASNLSAIQDNDTDISALQAEQVTQNDAIAALQSQDVTHTSQINTNTSNISANTTAITQNASDISALQAEQVTQDAAIAANASGVASNLSAIQDNDTDISALQAENLAQQGQIDQAELDILARTTALEVAKAIAHFEIKTKQIKPLEMYVDTPQSGGITMRTFYVDPGFASIDFAVDRLSCSAAPYTEVAAPRFDYESLPTGNGVMATDGTTTAELPAGSYAKISFYLSGDMPEAGEIEAFLTRFHRVDLSSTESVASDMFADYAWTAT